MFIKDSFNHILKALSIEKCWFEGLGLFYRENPLFLKLLLFFSKSLLLTANI